MEVNGEFELESPAKVREEIERSREAFKAWRVSAAERGKHIARLADVLLAGKRGYAETITREMGKPIRQSLTEIERSANICKYFGEHAEELTRDEVVETAFAKSYVTFEPLGVILAIMPWNFPVIELFRFAIPTMSAGNVVVLNLLPSRRCAGRPSRAFSRTPGFRRSLQDSPDRFRHCAGPRQR